MQHEQLNHASVSYINNNNRSGVLPSGGFAGMDHRSTERLKFAVHIIHVIHMLGRESDKILIPVTPLPVPPEISYSHYNS
jgi:hypothetical protein